MKRENLSGKTHNLMASKKEINEQEPNQKSEKPKVKFEVWGEEMFEKLVKSSGNSGRVYLPPYWIGHKVKIIRID